MATLVSAYRGLICDLDGVVYRGADVVPHAVEALDSAREQGVGVTYATNNASRPPQVVFEHLCELGLSLVMEDVLTSAMAGAYRLAELLPAGSPVLVVGGEGVRWAIEHEGLRPVTTEEAADGERPAAVLQGFGREVRWLDLAEAGYAIRGGAHWVATNPDRTVPTARGIAPGNGAMADVVREAVDVDPEITGKPYPPLYLRCADRLGCPPEQTLALGDRLDTDIEGGTRAGIDSLYVLTGVHRPVDVMLAAPERRPTYLATDLRALHEEYRAPVVEVDDAGNEGSDAVVATCGDVRVVLSGAGVDLGSGGTGSERLRAVVAAGTHHVEKGGELPPLPDLDAWIGDA